MAAIRQPAVSGMFYPAQAEALTAQVDSLLAAAATDAPAPKAMIAPHAGYAYSGSTAAQVYARLRNLGHAIERVILLGPDHRVGFRGMAAPSADYFATPLGQVPVDQAALQPLLQAGLVQTFDAAHAQEHSLEVHLPFLQRVLAGFKLVPLVVGQVEPDNVAAVIEQLWGGDETLIVISSDLSHFLSYEQARHIDQTTSAAIEALQGDAIGPHEACGMLPIRGMLQVAKAHGLHPQTVAMRNSGDLGAPRDRVVGYGAYVFS